MSENALTKTVRLQYFFDRAHYVARPGETIEVKVSLQETFNPRSACLLAPGTDGLVQGGVVVETTDPVPTCPAVVRATSAILGNEAFDFAAMSLLPGAREGGGVGVLELSDKPVFGEIVSRTGTCETVLLHLVTFTFTAGRVPGEVTFLTAMVPETPAVSPGDANVTYSGESLDRWIQAGSAMITVSPKAAGAFPAEKLTGLAGVVGLRSKHADQRH